ncbi:MAG: sporulation initiation factor Spo0A C-terminal domain-containing protein [Oscillospiraceae bacterium]|nr:sporulation initiation factor Spo0A C-terminal domain-containing protein [Oscillospiraceae bacterium]
MTLPDDELLVLIYDLLYRLGAKATHTGFFYTARATLLSLRSPDLLMQTTKSLYPEVAMHYNTSWQCVERCIRYTLSTIWDDHPYCFQRVTDYYSTTRPTPTEFIALLVQTISLCQ